MQTNFKIMNGGLKNEGSRFSAPLNNYFKNLLNMAKIDIIIGDFGYFDVDNSCSIRYIPTVSGITTSILGAITKILLLHGNLNNDHTSHISHVL